VSSTTDDAMSRVVGGIALTLGLLASGVAGAQPSRPAVRVGLLESGTLAGRAHLWEAFREGMRELGHVDGRTVIFEARSADGRYERLPGLAGELVRLKVAAVVVAGPSARQAVQHATETIPIVVASGDPLAEGAVTSLARPRANVTGVTTLTRELSAKRFDLAREIVPGASRLAILWDSASAGGNGMAQETAAAARAGGVQLQAVGARSPVDLDGAFAAIARHRPAVLLIAPSPMFFQERRRLAALAVRHRLPMVSAQREYAEAGGLVAYGANLPALFRRAAVYVDKILKGARPADLPIEQPTSFELIVNLRTAERLGVTIPPAVLLRATHTIP
jgi:putative ABC transport system substrate-binding protein